MVYRFFKRLKHTLYACNQNYYATRCRVKALPIMNQRIKRLGLFNLCLSHS